MAVNHYQVVTALVTPFKHGSLDIKSFNRLLRSQLEAGIKGFVVNGTTGESPSLALEEVKTLFDILRTECSGQAKIIVGTGTNSTASTLEFTKLAGRWGADAVLVVVPYYNKPPQRGLLQHFTTVADNSAAPLILYNVPSRTITSLDIETVATLSRHENILGIKEASGNLQTLSQLKQACEKDFLFLSGDDQSCVDFAAAGGHGVISVCSHVMPAELLKFMQQPQEFAKSYQETYAEFFKYLYCESNPIPVKMALHWMGLLESPELRLPLCELSPHFHQDFQQCLKKLAKI